MSESVSLLGVSERVSMLMSESVYKCSVSE